MPINNQKTTKDSQKATWLFCVPRVLQYLEDICLDNNDNSPSKRNVLKHVYKLNKTHFTKVHITTNF